MDGRNKARRWSWLWIYTALWLTGVILLLAIMRRSGRTLIWDPDGYKQHYTAIGMLGQAVRDLLRGRGYRMVNFSLGQGLDVLTTCAYYGYTDPLSLLAVPLSRQYIELAYNAAALLRMYLAGVFFGLYARRVGAKRHWALAVGATVYVYGHFFLRMLGRHPYFINGPMYLPLLLLGVERVLQERRWLMYTLVTALMLAVNFYFAYMNTVTAVLYILLRLAFRLRRRGVKESAKDGLMLLGGYLLGTALAAAVLWPVAKLYLSSSRVGVEAGYGGSMLSYNRSFYANMFSQLFSPAWSVGCFLNVGFLPLALAGLLGLGCRRDRGAAQAWIGIGLCLVGVGVPVVGNVMNGMAYVSNRWSYVLGFAVALGCALGLPEVFEGGAVRRRVMAAIVLACAAALAVYVRIGDRKLPMSGPVLLAATAALLPLYDPIVKRRGDGRAHRALALALTAVCCLVYVGETFLPQRQNLIGQQRKADVYKSISRSTAAQRIEDGGVYRVGQTRYDDAQAALLDYMGTCFYWSLVPDGISAYYKELQVPNMIASNRVQTLGGGASVNAVASVKYYIRKEDMDDVVPYGFEKREGELLDSKHWQLYENQWWLPLGYAFDARISQAEYDALPVEDKLRGIMEYAVCDGTALPDSACERRAVDVPAVIESMDNVNVNGQKLRVLSGGGTIRMTFDAPEDCEIYLLVEGLNMLAPGEGGPAQLSARGKNGVGYGSIRARNNNFYFDRHDFAFCLGEGPMGECTFTLSGHKTYTYDRLRVVALPLEAYREAAAARRAEGMTDVTLGNNRVTGRIEVAGDRVLQIAVPWSAGWRAWVDGVERPVFRCGGMYLGVELDAGAHDIELRYFTPGLKAGLAVSGAALLTTLALLIAGRRRRAAGKR